MSRCVCQKGASFCCLTLHEANSHSDKRCMCVALVRFTRAGARTRVGMWFGGRVCLLHASAGNCSAYVHVLCLAKGMDRCGWGWGVHRVVGVDLFAGVGIGTGPGCGFGSVQVGTVSVDRGIGTGLGGCTCWCATRPVSCALVLWDTCAVDWMALHPLPLLPSHVRKGQDTGQTQGGGGMLRYLAGAPPGFVVPPAALSPTDGQLTRVRPQRTLLNRLPADKNSFRAMGVGLLLYNFCIPPPLQPPALPCCPRPVLHSVQWLQPCAA